VPIFFSPTNIFSPGQPLNTIINYPKPSTIFNKINLSILIPHTFATQNDPKMCFLILHQEPNTKPRSWTIPSNLRLKFQIQLLIEFSSLLRSPLTLFFKPLFKPKMIASGLTRPYPQFS
jgi:hypothetical protein